LWEFNRGAEVLFGAVSCLVGKWGTVTSKALDTAILLAVLGVTSILTACGVVSGAPPLEVSVAKTQNPLVAQFTTYSGCSGQVMVQFGLDTTYGRSTSWNPVNGRQTVSIQVAGMRASTMYHMRAERKCSGVDDTSGDVTFTTGALPSSLPVPALQVSRPDPPQSEAENSGIEMLTLIGLGGNLMPMQALFTDRDGFPIWYYDLPPTYFPFTIKQLDNGHMLISMTSSSQSPGSMIREVDLAGNTIRELSINDLQTKAAAAGYDFSPAGYHHDVLPVPNGHILVLVNCYKDVTDLPGATGTTTVEGDAIIDLDQNWNPVWAWNSFDHLDVTRHLAAIVDGTLDWTHANALVYSANDGNILLSMRHQSWILKIDYDNGSGTGNILWRLGYEGDFQLTQAGAATDDPSLWFSFQHFPSLILQNGPQMSLAVWDNGDYRVLDSSGAECVVPGPPDCYSRAIVLHVDESAKTANLDWEYAPGLFSNWGGSVNQLTNGNIEFDVNDPLSLAGANIASEVQEVTQTSTPQLVWKMDVPTPTYAYRAYRVPSLYPGVTWQH
jgi:arylsulfate sulfotransferase